MRIAIQIASFAENLVGQLVGCGKNLIRFHTGYIFFFGLQLSWQFHVMIGNFNIELASSLVCSKIAKVGKEIEIAV